MLESFLGKFEFSSTSLLLILLLLIVSYDTISFWWKRIFKRLPPGPIGLPFVGCLPYFGSDPRKTLCDWQRKYGNIIGMRIGQSYMIVLNEYSVMKELYCMDGVLDRSPNAFPYSMNLGLVTSNGEKWHQQRKIGMKAIREFLGGEAFQNHLMEETSQFVEELRSHKGKPVDICHAIQYSVARTVLAQLMGKSSLECINADRVEDGIAYNAAVQLEGPLSAMWNLPALRKLFNALKLGNFTKQSKAIRKFFYYLRDDVSRRALLSEVKEEKSFVNEYLPMMLEISAKHRLTEDDLAGNIGGVFVGASDAVHVSLCSLLRILAEHKDVQQKMFNEIMEAFGEGGSSNYVERNKIPYTFATVLEGQRYAVVADFVSVRRTSKDIEIRGFIIPKGSDIVGNLFTIHYDPGFWKEPQKFKPERFLSQDGQSLANSPSFVPFSIGKRKCPGETSALMQLLAYVTQVVKKFEISLSHEASHKLEIQKTFQAHFKSVPLCFKERKKEN